MEAFVAVLTYKRPELLRKFLAEYQKLTIPEGVRVTLIVVDNDPAASAKVVLDEFGTRLGSVKYIVELVRGIPVARNRALDDAREFGGEVLCFIDDDEYPDPNWLSALIETYRRTGAQLIGGPVRVAPADRSLGPWKRFVNRSLMMRAIRNEARMARVSQMAGKFTVVTNNWLGDLGWLRDHNIRFDSEGHLHSGGSDTELFRKARKAGCIAAWSPDAIVYETILPSRLSLGYQLRRGRDQSINHFNMKFDDLGPVLIARTISIATARIVLGGLLMIVPVFGIASPVIAFRSVGWGLGRFDALRGRRSNHYG